MALPEMEMVKDAALKYDKPTLGKMAQMGQISPTIAVMAGMMRDRIVQSEMKPPSPPTVAEEVMQPAAQRMGLGAIAPQGQGQEQAATGLSQIPIPENMFEEREMGVPGMANGGVVAFQAGGQMSLTDVLRTLTMEEAREYQRTGRLPARAQAMLQGTQLTQTSAGINPRFEDIIAQAERGEGPNVTRPIAPLRLPQGLDEGDTPIQAQAPVVEETVVEAAPSANLPGINIDSIMSRAEDIASAIRPEGTRSVPTIQEASQQTTDLLSASGYDPNMLKTIREDIAKQREGLKGDKTEAMNMRLIEAGLAIMGGTSPYAFENIGKGATGAMKGLSEDIKDLKKSERDLRMAEQNLLMKQNDAAMGKAKITQGTIDKAQDRVDKEADNYNRTKADFAKTLLSGEIQERLARATYSTKITDYDKKWARYVEEAKARGETPSFSGFENALRESMGALTFKEALRIAAQDKGLTADEIEAQALKLMEVDKRRKADSGGQRGALSAQDQQALNWANSNPNDPRAKQIKDYLGAR